MKMLLALARGLLAVDLAAGACAQAPSAKDASDATRAANRALTAELPMADKRSFEDASRGLIEAFGDQVVTGPGGRTAWTLKTYDFLAKEVVPDSVNPALWRHARVNMANGLFKVTERVYQVRGVDISNMTVLEGDTGLIVIDPLTSMETAKAALDLYFKHRPRKAVLAVIYTHSHADHFGGVRGVISGDDVAAGKVKVIAPVGFMEEAIGENVIAGNAMSRRSLYQFGMLPRRGEKGQVDAGLGKTVPLGTITLIPPTMLIVVVTGKREKLGELLGLIETSPNMFALVEPRPAR